MKITTKLVLGLLALNLGLTATATPNKTFESTEKEPAKAWQLNGFSEPESVLADDDKGLLYVSNIKGQPNVADGQGYISLISKNGEFIEKQWLVGLDAPKGMAIYKNLLYVADLQQLHVIDRNQGKLLHSIKVHSSKMLNDVAIDDRGTVYISDLLGGGIYRFANNEITQWISAEALPHTNGLYFHQKKLLVATWGLGLQADFSTKELGSVYSVDPTSGIFSLLKGTKNIGNLDGIAMHGTTIYVNDWLNGNVFTYKSGKLTLTFNAGKHAADISINNNTLLVPMMFNNQIKAYRLD